MISSFTGEHRFLSNFYWCRIMIDGIPYPTVEHAFQAQKTLDKPLRLHIAKLSTPGEAKKVGRGVVLRPGWDGMRDTVMARLIAHKFPRQTLLAAQFLDTEDEELVEGNHWHDNYWGNCYCGRASCVMTPGENKLGKLLMARRAQLQGKET